MPTPPAPSTHQADLPRPVAERSSLAFGPFVLDRQGGQLLREGVAVSMAPKTLAVLEFLASRAGTLVSKDELLDGVWGHRFVSDSALKVAINDLRTGLGEDAREPRWVHTVMRRGYRFTRDVHVQAGAAGAGPAVPPLPAVPGNLPPDAGLLLGRDDDVARVHAALSGQRLLTITGPSGVGKTRLALATAGHAPPADGVWLLRLDALSTADAASPALARLLGFGDTAGADPHSLARALKPLHLRLVLDNAEHLASTLAPQLALWLQQAPGLQLLVTSQRPLRLTGEQLLPLAPLPMPAMDTAVHALPANPAVALLVQRVQALQPDWLPGPAEHVDLAEIARGLDGLPLALELAAARVPLLGSAGVRERLAVRLQMLTRGAADAPGRHRTLRAALEWSVGLLPEPVARLFDLCSVFVGGFTLTAAQHVAAQVLPGQDEWDVLDALEQLRELALVVDAGTPDAALVPLPGSTVADAVPLDWRPAPRLRLFDSVALFGRERLRARGEAARAEAAHQHWLRAVFNEADRRQLDLGEAIWLARLAPETANLQAGLSSALGTLCPTPAPPALVDALELFVASASFLLRSGLRRETLNALQQLQTALQACAQAPPPLLMARLDMTHTLLSAMALQPPADGIAAAQRAESILREQGERRRLLLLLYLKGLLDLRYAGAEAASTDLQAMRSFLGAMPSIYERRLPDWLGAMLARERGDLDGYRAFWAGMLAESLQRGDRLEAWKAAWGLGQTLFLQQRVDEAIAVMDEAIADMRASQRLRANALMVGQGALMRLARDASPATLAGLCEAVQVLRSDGLVSTSLGDALPWVAWWQGRADDALRLQRWADETSAERGEKRGALSDQLRAAFMARTDGRALPAASGLDDEGALRLALGASFTALGSGQVSARQKVVGCVK